MKVQSSENKLVITEEFIFDQNKLPLDPNNHFNSPLASRQYCQLLITFANSLDPDQDRRNVGPDREPSCLTL